MKLLGHQHRRILRKWSLLREHLWDNLEVYFEIAKQMKTFAHKYPKFRDPESRVPLVRSLIVETDDELIALTLQKVVMLELCLCESPKVAVSKLGEIYARAVVGEEFRELEELREELKKQVKS